MSSQSATVTEATDVNFQAAVLDKSQEVPVLVDFWAPWCGPCKVIGPILDKLAGEGAGKFELVKVNVDESPMVAQILRIQSIPAVKLFINGEIHGEFLGAYPEPEVRKFLEKYLPSDASMTAVDGMQLYQLGRTAEAARVFRAVLEKEPSSAAALLGMGTYHIDRGDVAEASQMVSRISEAELERIAKNEGLKRALAVLRARIFLTEGADNGRAAAGKDIGEDDLDARFQQACRQALKGAFQPALDELLRIVRKDRKLRDDGARKAMLAVFDLLPHTDPIAQAYRQKLSFVLFS
ncbi:MAG: tetratricopeptide repeat protein [Candidatus Lambdaproteobacteria bacterium]|nr:tetratricopeptide repeat protein [Candidatus Lambdaproteobacteria bacterium]